MTGPIRHHLRIDVSSAIGWSSRVEVAATVVLPDDAPGRPRTAIFGFPGGGYGRHYYDLVALGADRPLPGYSQAEHHASDGFVFVACDHLGVGDSDVPELPIGFEAVAAADMAAASAILERLRSGTCAPDLGPVEVTTAVALGQSFGGFLLTIGQANDPVFDGIGLLGWSGIRTLSPYPPGTRIDELQAGREDGTRAGNPRARMFHFPDVADEIVEADLSRAPGWVGSSAPWGSRHRPGGPLLAADRSPLDPGAVAGEAARITVPVFVGAGEVDVVGEPHAEALAYVRSPDVTIATFPRMAHMHNFATTRRVLWRRISLWASTCHEVGHADDRPAVTTATT